MIGLLFGELKRLSVLRRVALVAGAVAIALFANFVRAVFLVRSQQRKIFPRSVAGMTLPATPSSLSFSWAPWGSRICSAVRNHLWWQACRLQNLEPGSRHGCLYSSRFLTSLRPFAGSCSSRLERPHGIAFTNAISSAAYVGMCNGQNKRPTFVNSKSTKKFAPSSDSTRATRQLDNQFASKGYRAEYCLLFLVRFSLETGQKQRAFGEPASARCMFARKRLEAGGGSWSTQLSHERFV